MELLLLTTIIAGGLGWFAFHHRGHAREHPHANALRDDEAWAILVVVENVAPDCLRRLVGRDLLPDYFRRVTAVYVDLSYGFEPRRLDRAVPHLMQLRRCHTLNVAGQATVSDFPFALFSKAPQLRTLDLSDSPGLQIDVDGASNVSYMQQITRLIVPERSSLTPEALVIIRRDMPNCEVIYEQDLWLDE